VRRQFSRHVADAAPVGDDFGEADAVHNLGFGFPHAGFEPCRGWRNQPFVEIAGRNIGNRNLNRITGRVDARCFKIETQERRVLHGANVPRRAARFP
jgi:hypothetical protein